MDRPSNQMPLPVPWTTPNQGPPQQQHLLPNYYYPHPAHPAIPAPSQYWSAPMNSQQYTYQEPSPYYGARPYMIPEWRPVTRWTMRSKIYYEILRANKYPEDLSRCLAGQQSGFKPPKAFNKLLWNEANAVAAAQYPEWLDEENPEHRTKLQELLDTFVTQRRMHEHVRDQKEQKEREKAKAQSLKADAGFNTAQDRDENAAAAVKAKVAEDRPSVSHLLY